LSRLAKPFRVQDFILTKKLGSGSFGEIYLAKHLNDDEEVAIKMEKASSTHPQLSHEYKVYKVLKSNEVMGFPKIRFFGTENDYNVLIMERLGQSLEGLFDLCNRKFSMKTILMLIEQMLHRVEYVHTKLLIHRDIKPENFLMGHGQFAKYVFMIDFGLAKRYRSSRSGRHIPYRENKSLTGTARYASINAHLGIEQSRRDDLESLGFVIMYFLRGRLPWQGLRAVTKKEKYDKISERKMSTPIEVLCKGFPDEFAQYLQYCRALRFDDKPDYSHLRRIFRKLFMSLGLKFDYVYDWTVPSKDDKSSRSVGSAELDVSAPEEDTPELTYLPAPFTRPEDDAKEQIYGSIRALKPSFAAGDELIDAVHKLALQDESKAR